MIILNFIIGVGIIAAAVASLHWNYQLVNMVGRNNIFERKLGPGTSYPVFKLLSIVAILIGFFVTFSLHDEVISFLFEPILSTIGL